MTQKEVVDNSDSVEESHRNGTEGTISETEISGLKSALQKERARAKALEKAAKAAEGIDLDEYQRLKTEAEAREHKKLEEKGEFDKLRQKWGEEKARELSERDKLINEMKSEIRKFKLDDKVKAVALKSGIRSDRIEQTMRLVIDSFDLDDKGQIIVKDADGDPSELTVDKFFASTFREQMPEFFQGSGATGTGVTGSKPGKADMSKLSSVQKIAHGLKNL